MVMSKIDDPAISNVCNAGGFYYFLKVQLNKFMISGLIAREVREQNHYK